MEDRPSSTSLVYNLGSSNILLRPSSGAPSGSMTSSMTESTLWTLQSSSTGDSLSTSFGLSPEPIGNDKLSHMNDPQLTEYMHNDMEKEFGSPRSRQATAASHRAPNHLESPTSTETQSLQGHEFSAADFFPQSLLSKDPVYKSDSLATLAKFFKPP